jgi:RNA polymerase sigma-70 factor, ECF subfamily
VTPKKDLNLAELRAGAHDTDTSGVTGRFSAVEVRQDEAGTASSVVTLPRGRIPDAVLVREVTEGRPAAIAELFDRYSGLVRRMLTRTLGSSHDIEDLAQETFLTVIRRCRTLRDAEALDSFVIGVAIRIARNEVRKRRLRRMVGLDQALEPAVAPAVDPVAREGVRRLYQALDRLDAGSRVLFVLRHVEELELTELARAEGCSLATVKRRLARAEQRFEAIAEGDPVLRVFLRRRA